MTEGCGQVCSKSSFSRETTVMDDATLAKDIMSIISLASLMIVKKTLFPLLMLPVIYVGLVPVVIYSLDNDAPYIAIIYAVIGAVAIALALRKVLTKTVTKGMVPYSTVNALEPVGSNSGDDTRNINITISRYATNGKFTLYLDDSKIVAGAAGDRFMMPITAYAHRFRVSSGTSVELIIPAGGDCDFYIWYDRTVKDSKNTIQVDEVTNGIEILEAEDARSYEKFKKIMDITPIGGGISFLLAVIIVMLI